MKKKVSDLIPRSDQSNISIVNIRNKGRYVQLLLFIIFLFLLNSCKENEDPVDPVDEPTYEDENLLIPGTTKIIDDSQWQSNFI